MSSDRCRVACSSDWPPERNTTPGTAAGTVQRKQRIVLSATSRSDGWDFAPYPASKRAGELLCYNYHHLYGLKVSCLRFFTVYGPAQRPEMAIHKFTDLLARGEKVPMFGDGASRRDYTYVDDIIDGLVAAMDLAPGFEILNLGGAETTALKDLIHGLAAELDVEPAIEYLPAQPGDVPITYADVGKAGRLLGYSPKVPIREGLRRFVAWYRQQQDGHHGS